ncbi:Non-histone chromosomal protein 6 [Cyphellophora attinorum]|uniref:Non-histone chromosomal protein 6 n=1 Tax=Cyphellophora attinorum TaxID=1664694 RepID=A0A0N1P0W0_9EURO|nr:Non-histone chromosomal protein 6 [Phialophora attinorum]KPI39607.1 Non-histone chromosomal protein 6 [Phialophora attinorum]
MTADLGVTLGRLGLEQYLDVLIGEGFETWDTLLDIQETDFEALGIKLGHRRKLQRAIAEYRGIPYERLYAVISQDSPVEGARGDGASQSSGGTTGLPGAPAAGIETKRKYRRHPKADENAPERPPSAYVIFSNQIREEVKEQNLSFTQIAKLVGDRWQKLNPQGKEPYEEQANAAKERYNIQLSAYKKTDAFKEYSLYLTDFKAKHGGGAIAGPSEQKRPKLDAQDSLLSAGSATELGQTPLSVQTQPQPSMPLPTRHGATGQRAASPPPGYTRDNRWRPAPSGSRGQVSKESSLSEESSAPRSDSDPLVRTASLSLSTPPTATPPLPIHGDKPSSVDSGRARFPGPPPSLPSYGSTTSGHSVALPSPMGSESSWRGRPTELRSYMDAGAAPMQPPLHLPPPQAAAITLPPLPPILGGGDRSSDLLVNRTLPFPRGPPPVQPGHTTNAPPFFSGPPYPIRRESTAESPVERSESEAATTLAGLASGTPGSRPGSTPAQERRWPGK